MPCGRGCFAPGKSLCKERLGAGGQQEGALAGGCGGDEPEGAPGAAST